MSLIVDVLTLADPWTVTEADAYARDMPTISIVIRRAHDSVVAGSIRGHSPRRDILSRTRLIRRLTDEVARRLVVADPDVGLERAGLTTGDAASDFRRAAPHDLCVVTAAVAIEP